MNLPGFDRPVFIARVLNNEYKYIDGYSKFDGVIMDANLATHFYKMWGKILQKRNNGAINFLMVDPNTAKLENRFCIGKKTYQRLSYCPEIEPYIPDDFLNDGIGDFTQGFVNNVLSTQVSLEADVLLSPYFVANTVRSPWYEVNLNLAQTSIDMKEQLGYEQPLYATICVSVAELVNEKSRRQIVLDYHNLEVDGYYILAEGLADRVSGSEELAGLLALVKELSEIKKPIINGYVDGFGMFASAFGSSGFSAGICWLESFDEQNFALELDGRNEDSMRERFIYIPEVFIKFPRDRAQLVYANIPTLTSNKNSNFYNQRRYDWNDRARYFFLEKRYEELDDLSGMTDAQKLVYLKDRLDNALEICEQIYEEDIRIQYAHLERWKEAINSEMVTI